MTVNASLGAVCTGLKILSFRKGRTGSIPVRGTKHSKKHPDEKPGKPMPAKVWLLFDSSRVGSFHGLVIAMPICANSGLFRRNPDD